MGRSDKKRRLAKKRKKEEEKVTIDVRETREKAIKKKTEPMPNLKYSIGSQVGKVIAGNLIVRNPSF